MLSNISWTTYFISVATATTAWYIIIGLKYYMNDLQSFLKKIVASRSVKNRQPDGGSAFDNDDRNEFSANDPDDLMSSVQELVAKLKKAIAEASERQFKKAESMYSLQRILRQYPAVKDSSYRTSIEQLIQLEVQRTGFMTLDAEEVAMLWSETGA